MSDKTSIEQVILWFCINSENWPTFAALGLFNQNPHKVVAFWIYLDLMEEGQLYLEQKMQSLTESQFATDLSLHSMYFSFLVCRF